MPAATIDYMKLALLVDNGSVITGNEGMRQHQVAVLQPADGEWGVGNVNLFLARFVDKHQSSGRNGFGHKAIAPEVGCACRDHRTDVKKSTTCMYGTRPSPRDPPDPQIVVFVTVTIDFLRHPSVQKRRNRVPCTFKAEEKRNRANAPYPNPLQPRLCQLPRRHAAMGRTAPAV